MSTQQAVVSTKKTFLSVRWRIAILLLLSYVVWYMDRTNISIVGPVMMKEFGWSPTDFGLVQSAFFVGYSLTQIPGGWLADRFGGSKVIIFGTLWWSAFVFLTPFAATITSMCIVRALMGLGEGVNAPTHTSLTARWMPRSEAGMAQSVYYIGMPVGIMITMPTAVWLTEHYGWQSSFYVFAVVGIIWVAAWHWYGCDKPRQHKKITAEELAVIEADQDDPSIMDQPTEWKPILKSSSVWGLTIAYFFHNYLWYLFMTWLPGYLVMERGLSLLKSGLYTVIPYLVACFSMPLGGWLSDRLSEKYGPTVGRRLPIVIGMGGCGLFLALAADTPTAERAITYIAASVGFLTLNYGAFWSTPINLSSKDAGVISGMMNTSGNIAGILAPTITGVIVTFSSGKFEKALYFTASLAVVGILALLTIGSVEPIRFVKTKTSLQQQ